MFSFDRIVQVASGAMFSLVLTSVAIGATIGPVGGPAGAPAHAMIAAAADNETLGA